MNYPGLLPLLETADSRILCFDMGRRISPLARREFIAFEKAEIPYPLPLRQQAWFALVRIKLQQADKPLIWFLRLPLDEQGKLVLAARDYFLHRMLESMARADATQDDPLAGAFTDNPHTFTPKPESMAIFHARLRHALELPPSRYHRKARQYLSGDNGWQDWRLLGYQGIADIAVRCAEADTGRLLRDAIPCLPDEPLVALCHCLEHQPVHRQVSEVLLARLRQALDSSAATGNALVAALVRALGQASVADHRRQMFTLVLNGGYRTDIEVLAAIAGRAWELLQNREAALEYMEALADNPGGQRVFESCMRDLLPLPGMREPLRSALDGQAAGSTLLQARMQTLMTTVNRGSA